MLSNSSLDTPAATLITNDRTTASASVRAVIDRFILCSLSKVYPFSLCANEGGFSVRGKCGKERAKLYKNL
jgi:hypothetical protein